MVCGTPAVVRASAQVLLIEASPRAGVRPLPVLRCAAASVSRGKKYSKSENYEKILEYEHITYHRPAILSIELPFESVQLTAVHTYLSLET